MSVTILRHLDHQVNNHRRTIADVLGAHNGPTAKVNSSNHRGVASDAAQAAWLSTLDAVQPGATDGQFYARCPAHPDRNPSLSIHLRPGQPPLVHCHAGCNRWAIFEGAGWVEGVYPYRDEQGRTLFEVVRLIGKHFEARRPGPDGTWKSGAGNVRVLYRLPELLKADPRVPVIITEGEKDAETLVRLGFVATCNPFGAGKWEDRYSESLRGRDVILLGDNDDKGRQHVERVSRALLGIARRVRIARVPEGYKDVTEWVEAGATRRDIARAIREAEEIAAAALPEPAKSASGFPLTDAGNAEAFVAACGADLRFDHIRRVWLVWQPPIWKPDRDGQVHRLYLQTLRQRQKAALDITEDPRRREAVEHLLAAEATYRIQAALSIAEKLPPVATTRDRFDVNHTLFAAANGVIDLTTGAFREGRRDDYLTLQAPVAYDRKAKAPRWRKFLLEVFGGRRELTAFVQRAVGYSLTALQTEQVFFLCFGTGFNGKSTFLGVLQALFGDYGTSTSFATFAERVHRPGTATPELAGLRGKRFVVAVESAATTVLDEATLKLAAGGDRISARALYSSPEEFDPTFKIWLCTNHLPRVRDLSLGFWRKPVLVPFEQNFAGREDKDLLSKLLAELPGILNWAIEGCLAWRNTGLNIPEVCRDATRDWRADNDPLAAFVADGCIEESEAMTPMADLFDGYREFCRLNNLHANVHAGHTFSRLLLAHNPAFKRVFRRGHPFCKGLRLVEKIQEAVVTMRKSTEFAEKARNWPLSCEWKQRL